MNYMRSKIFFFLGILSLLMLASCKKIDVQADENDEEIITTMQLKFTAAGAATSLVYQFDDADGPGGANPVQDIITLAPNTTYRVSITLLNKTTNPVSNITDEVRTESIAHRFYYQPTAGSNMSVSNFDVDANGIPLGVESTWTTGAAATGNISVTLRHYPNDPPNKALDDLVSSTKSGTDIAVTFSTVIN